MAASGFQLFLFLPLLILIVATKGCVYNRGSSVALCVDIGDSLKEFTHISESPDFKNCRKVFVVGGVIADFDFNFETHESITMVVLSNLGISNFTERNIFRKMKNLQNLDLSDNALTVQSVPHLPPTIYRLNLSGNKLEARVRNASLFFPFLSGRRTPHLRVLDLSNNRLETFYYKDEGTLTGLTSLDLSGNPLKQIYLTGPKLLYLNMSHTQLNNLQLNMTNAFKGFRPKDYKGKTRMVDLSYATYTTLDPIFVEQILSEHLGGVKLRMNFEGNPWSCGCGMKPLMRQLAAIKTSEIGLELFDSIQCGAFRVVDMHLRC